MTKLKWFGKLIANGETDRTGLKEKSWNWIKMTVTEKNYLLSNLETLSEWSSVRDGMTPKYAKNGNPGNQRKVNTLKSRRLLRSINWGPVHTSHFCRVKFNSTNLIRQKFNVWISAAFLPHVRLVLSHYLTEEVRYRFILRISAVSNSIQH